MNVQKINGKMTRMNKKLIIGASVSVALAVLISGYITFGKSSSYASVPKSNDPVHVSAITIVPKTIDMVVSAVGTLNAKNTSVLSSKVMGKVTDLKVQEGDYVSQGKLLLKIESGEISAQLYQAQAAFNNAKLQYDRIKSLFDVQAATQMEMDQATLGFESARAGLNAAKAMESYTVITAPIAGQIVEKRINIGEMAMPGQPILKIEDNKNLRIEVTVGEQEISSIQPGKAVTVRIDALPNKVISGRVAQVIRTADVRTHSFVVKIDIPADKNLISGMYGKAVFSTGKREAILVPKSAVFSMSGITGVYIVSVDGTAFFQMIQPGEVRGDEIEAVSGLKSGDRVILNGRETSIDGKSVTVADK
jgi:RND family efflux transporter MFP subunit